jgi:hypothetical protein
MKKERRRQELCSMIAIGGWGVVPLPLPRGNGRLYNISYPQRGRKPHAHSDFIRGPMNLYGRDADVDGVCVCLVLDPMRPGQGGYFQYYFGSLKGE